tara:strand:+ start:914 stop:2944 length:2031 start_codon:yes stop_codon:yes gene_type:complete
MKQSNIQLNEKQESDLLKYLKNRFEQLKEDNRERIDADKQSWKSYHNLKDDRVIEDTIFAQSNLSVPLTTLVVDHFMARAEDEITGTSPYFKFDAQGPSDLEMAESYDKYFNWKIEDRAETRERLEESYLHIFVQRAVIMKSVYEEDVSTWFDRERNALFNNETQEFEEIPGEGPILEGEARFLPEPNPVTGETEMRLATSPTFQMVPGVHQFQPFPEGVPTQQVKYKGPRSEVIDSDRFLCPSTVESIEKSDILAELYDKDMRWVREIFLEREWFSYEDYRHLMKKDANPRSDIEKNEGRVENLDFDSEQNPSVPIVEFWLKRDILGTGQPQEFCVFYDPENEKLLYYEYVAKLTPDNRIPYSVVSIGKERNKWCGYSLPERIKTFQHYIDKQFNSQSYRNELSANPIIGVNPQAVEDEPEDVELHAGKIFELKDQYTIDDFIGFSQVPQADMKTQELIDFVFGIVQLWLGVSNMAQGDYQALAPANTATGVEATLREASKIGRRWMRRIVKGFEGHLTKMVKIAMATMDEAEVYEYMEGDVRAFAVMTPEMIENLDVNVRVILSQDQGQRAIEKANLALQTQERYFQSPPEMRPFMRPMLKRILDAMGYERTDELLPPEAPPDPKTEAEIMKMMGDNAAPGGESPQPRDGVMAATEGMGNSNPQGQNQYQQQTG